MVALQPVETSDFALGLAVRIRTNHGRMSTKGNLIMTIVTMEEAQAHLPELVAHLGSGEELIITQDHKPIAKLVRENPPSRKPRKAGNCIGMIRIVADDDEHLQDFAEYM